MQATMRPGVVQSATVKTLSAKGTILLQLLLLWLDYSPLKYLFITGRH